MIIRVQWIISYVSLIEKFGNFCCFVNSEERQVKYFAFVSTKHIYEVFKIEALDFWNCESGSQF